MAAKPGSARQRTVGNPPLLAARAGRQHPARRSIALLLTLGLALTTALALLGTVAALSRPPAVGPETTGDRAAIDRFYAAVNTAIRTGAGTALDEVVAPDLVTHDARSGAEQDRTSFDDHLAALHAADPSLQLVVEEIIVEGDRAAIRLTARSSRTGSFLGMPLDGRIAPWPKIDLLRLAEGSVAERWVIGDAGVVVRPVVQTRLDPFPPEAESVGLIRITLAPGARVTKEIDAAMALFAVEAGEVLVRGAGEAALVDAGGESAEGFDAVARSADRVLLAGDAVVVPVGVHLQLRNESAAPAVALGIALTAAIAQPGGVLGGVRVAGQIREQMPVLDWPVGVTVEPLAADTAGSLPAGAISLTLDRATLGPRASLPPHAAAAVELLAVESGRLALKATGPVAVVDSGIGQAPAPRAAAVGGLTGSSNGWGLTRAAGAVLYGGAVAVLRNPDETPVVVWVVTIAPAESGLGAG